MQYQQMGYRIRGFYKAVSFSQKVETIMKAEAKQNLMHWHFGTNTASMQPSQCANSEAAAAFAQLVKTVFLTDIHQVLTDNGSEYKGRLADYS